MEWSGCFAKSRCHISFSWVYYAIRLKCLAWWDWNLESFSDHLFPTDWSSSERSCLAGNSVHSEGWLRNRRHWQRISACQADLSTTNGPQYCALISTRNRNILHVKLKWNCRSHKLIILLICKGKWKIARKHRLFREHMFLGNSALLNVSRRQIISNIII